MHCAYSPKKCLICGLSIYQDDSISYFAIHSRDLICGKCRRLLKPYPYACQGEILYFYDDFFKQLLFNYKAQGDLALAPVFLTGHVERLRRRYRKYVIVPAPSNEMENQKRGFVHLVEIFKSLSLPIYSVLYKKEAYKQAVQPWKLRERIKNVIDIHDEWLIKDRYILLVDDVTTSGMTLQACESLLWKAQAKSIQRLVLASGQKEQKTLHANRKKGYKKL